MQGHLLHVVPPKKLHRQLRNLGWRAKKGRGKQELGMKKINWLATEHADKGGEGAGGWGGIGRRQQNKQKCKRHKNPTWGGPAAAAQLSWLESVALF